MRTISPESFAMVCFIQLMQKLNSKSPDYITEKMDVLGRGYEAFAALDIYNMREVYQWCLDWKIEIPVVIQKEMKLQNDAFFETLPF